jgi:hypothetical protein
MTQFSHSIREQVYARGKWQCEYCQTQQSVVIELVIDHIIPLSVGGASHLDNLCLACISCNQSKSDHRTGIDPDTGQLSDLFNPRRQKWSDHFQWDGDFIHLLGLSPTGRATIERLKINRENVLIARRRWVATGLHPPDD